MAAGEKNEDTQVPEEGNHPHETPWDHITEQVLDFITEAFPKIERRDDLLKDEPSFICDPSVAFQVAKELLNNPYSRMNYLRSVTGIERADCLEVAYNFMNIPTGTRVCLHVRCGKDSPSVPSLTPLWAGADLQEREVYDMFGINFDGHPDLRRILLDEGFINHPLRKDYPLQGKLEDVRAMHAYLPAAFKKRLEDEAAAGGG